MAKPPPRITAKNTIAVLDAPYAVPMPIIAAMNATKTSPSRNKVAVIRTVSPRSGAYLVRARPGAHGADDRDLVPARAGLCRVHRRDYRHRDGVRRVQYRDRVLCRDPGRGLRHRVTVLLRQDRAGHGGGKRGKPD